MDTLGRGMGWDDARFHHTTQDGTQLKTYKLFISGISHLPFLDHGELQTRNNGSKTVDEGLLLYDSLELESINSSLKCRGVESVGVTRPL